ncbi:MAG: hypothetical protein AB7E72_16690 [Lysobacterales bacterium]
MRLLMLLIPLLLLLACSEDPAPVVDPVPPPAPPKPAVPAEDLYQLAVGGNGFRPDMRMADLRARFGEDQVSAAEVPLGEGQSEPGAIVHPQDPARRAYVYFLDGNPESTISAIHVRDPESIWRGPLGLHLGNTSLDLDRMNGRPFRFLGFEWDYGGYVSNWVEGALSRLLLPPGQLAVRLAPPVLAEGVDLPKGYPRGEGEFPSDLAAVHERPPVVVEMGLAFAPEVVENAPADSPTP